MPSDRTTAEREGELALYPRHFGVTFREAEDFEALHRLCLQRKIEMFRDLECSVRGFGRSAPHLRPARPVRQPDRVQALRRPQNDVLRCRRSFLKIDSSPASGTPSADRSPNWSVPAPFRRVTGRSSSTPARSGCLSFEDLALAVEQWAGMLRTSGIDEGSTVGLVISDPIDFSIAFLGTMAAGRWAAPLDPTTPVHGTGGLLGALGRVGADVVFADRSAPDGIDVDWVALGGTAPTGRQQRHRDTAIGAPGCIGWCGPGLVGHDGCPQGDPVAPRTTPARRPATSRRTIA